MAEGVMPLIDYAMTLPPWMRVGFEKIDNPVPSMPDATNYVAHEGVRTLGEIYDICTTLPAEGKFIMVFFHKETGNFLHTDESIFNITIEHDHQRLCMYSGYHDECSNIKNKDFLFSCDPTKTGRVYRAVNKDATSWVINEDTPLYVRTKRHGNHTINDVIAFDYNGQPYVGLVSNVFVN